MNFFHSFIEVCSKKAINLPLTILKESCKCSITINFKNWGGRAEPGRKHRADFIFIKDLCMGLESKSDNGFKKLTSLLGAV